MILVIFIHDSWTICQRDYCFDNDYDLIVRKHNWSDYFDEFLSPVAVNGDLLPNCMTYFYKDKMPTKLKDNLDLPHVYLLPWVMFWQIVICGILRGKWIVAIFSVNLCLCVANHSNFLNMHGFLFELDFQNNKEHLDLSLLVFQQKS